MKVDKYSKLEFGKECEREVQSIRPELYQPDFTENHNAQTSYEKKTSIKPFFLYFWKQIMARRQSKFSTGNKIFDHTYVLQNSSRRIDWRFFSSDFCVSKIFLKSFKIKICLKFHHEVRLYDFYKISFESKNSISGRKFLLPPSLCLIYNNSE